MSERVSKHSPKKLLQPGLGTGAALLLLLGMIFYGFFDRPDVFSGGEARLDCLSENVEIYFDEYSIKHINAANLPDLFRAVGYLHASTHLAEMDRLLRVATGQMAAARGEKFIDLDVAARRLGFSAKARQIQPQLSTPAKVVLEAYCEGVNAFIATQKDLWRKVSVFQAISLCIGAGRMSGNSAVTAMGLFLFVGRKDRGLYD
jgi:acyl-homoserine lactone acylase PvdQ